MNKNSDINARERNSSGRGKKTSAKAYNTTVVSYWYFVDFLPCVLESRQHFYLFSAAALFQYARVDCMDFIQRHE